jgi:hypothetical protein
MSSTQLEGPDLFISYSRTPDLKAAAQVRRSVKRIGLPFWGLKRRRVFLDIDGMHATPDAQRDLIKKLSQSRFMALLACPKSAESDWVQCELGFARDD